MHGEKPTKILSKSVKRGSLTEQILTLCASGHFGVREAIATALKSSTAEEPSQPSPKIKKEGAPHPRQEEAD
jgi:hypothetical protein